ncbi:hypothetical protein V5738_11090 [Salinisphaera sp. SPP-AMP-43]|uniref:J domain-containing protein n=1 Tax=Salinisphaera sp. SPP-AMP-43 TaxID=3121288 RepID=UPI003C6DF913
MREDIQRYPLQWPATRPRTPGHEREVARFGKRNSAGWGNKSLSIAEARDRVLSELDKITPHGKAWRVPPDSIVISTNVPTRRDGLPYSNAREPDDPGVCVYFTIDGEDRCAPCDKWTRVADNLAAIAKNIEADRGKERWGVSSMVESYPHPALPSPDQAGSEHWSDILGVQADIATDDEIYVAYLSARRAAHPDSGGSSEAFHRVQRAWQQAKQERGL